MTPKTTQAIIKMRQSLNLDREEWRNWAIFLARFHLDAAPDKVRGQFTGTPSKTSSEAVELAEIFALLYVKTEDTAQAVKLQYSLSTLWSAALHVQGAIHE